MLNINNGKIKFENVGYAKNYADISFWKEKVRNDENTYPQSVVDIGKDKVYMVWSNEKLKIPNQAVALSLGQSAGDIVTEATRQVTNDIIGNIGGDIVGGIAGNIIGGAIMDMFAPSKKLYVLEMELEKVNDYELIGRFCNQIIKIDGNGKPDITKEEKDIHFVKYDIESGVFFGSYGDKEKKYIPGYGISEEFPQRYKSMFAELVKKYPERFSSLKLDEYSECYSFHQKNKLFYYNDVKMLQEGCKMSEQYHQFTKTAYLGIDIKPGKDERPIINNKNANGVYVYAVTKGRPAYLFGIKKGDIIKSIDGYEMNNPEQLFEYLNTLKPYDWIIIHIKRGNKEMDIKAELSYESTGKGIARYDNGDVFEGELTKGVINGWGKYKWKNGEIYEGKWANNVPHGKGVFHYKDGDVMEGEWNNGIVTGKVKVRYKNGDIFEGVYGESKRNGEGVLYYADGSKHKGTFKDHKRNGFFVEEDKSGNRFEGNYVDDKRHGRFVEKDRNGNITAQGNYNHGKRKED